MSAAWLVVGLGNPGPEYAATRHNIGAMVVDQIAEDVRAPLARHKRAHAVCAEAKLGVPGSMTGMVLARPLTFMNTSGGPVAALMAFYGIEPDHLVVVHDELDIPFAALRVKFGGGDNGHNGLKSIRKSLGSGDFFRIRMGIGRPPGRQDPADFVLKPFGSTERKDLPDLVQRGADAVESLCDTPHSVGRPPLAPPLPPARPEPAARGPTRRREAGRVCVRARVCVRVCVCVCARARVHVCVCVGPGRRHRRHRRLQRRAPGGPSGVAPRGFARRRLCAGG